METIAAFFLVAVIKADNGFSFSDIASFKSQDECQQTLTAVTDKISSTGQTNADFYCISADALERVNHPS